MRNLIFDELGILTPDEIKKLGNVISSLSSDAPGVELGIKITGSNLGKDPHADGDGGGGADW